MSTHLLKIERLKEALAAILDTLRTDPRPAKDPMDEVLLWTGADVDKYTKSRAALVVSFDGGGYDFLSPESDYPKYADENRAKLEAAGKRLGFYMEDVNNYQIAFYQN